MTESRCKPFGLYLHIPFCAAKCRYCDFYSARGDAAMFDRYTDALCKRINEWGGIINRPITSVYFGGGTPSLIGGTRISSVLSAVHGAFDVCGNAEITVEVNPQTAGAELFNLLRSSGVNRVSIGVQSADDRELKTLGRTHSAALAEETFYAARKAGFDNISLDLMLALPDSNAATLQRSLDFFAGLRPEHISAYILKLEEKTVFFKMRDTLRLPDEDETCRQYNQVCDFLCDNGYEHYEISNFSLPGRRGLHNINYWRGGEYLGLGPAAHSFIDGKRFYYPKSINGFTDGAHTVDDGSGGDAQEYLMLRLRLSDGLDIGEFKRRYDIHPGDGFYKKLALFEKGGFCRTDGGRISLTRRGMLVSNEIITELECQL